MTRRLLPSSSCAAAVVLCLIARRPQLGAEQRPERPVSRLPGLPRRHRAQPDRGSEPRTTPSARACASTSVWTRSPPRRTRAPDAIARACDSRRQDGGLSVTRKFDDLKFTIGGAYSQENFYRATTGLTSLSRDLAKGNTTVAGGFSFSLNQPVLHPTPGTGEPVSPATRYASITQTLTKTTIAQAGYEVGRIAGYQDNPFLRANVNGSWCSARCRTRARGRRSRRACVRRCPADTYLEADYRHYFDDWQVTSNTFSAGVSHRFGPQVLMNVVVSAQQTDRRVFLSAAVLGVARSISRRTSGSSRSRRTTTRERWCSRRKASCGGCRRAPD